MMKNPWETIKLDDYENHMKLASVSQLQAMNQMMKGQLDYPVSSVMILGVAGGNGLEHIQKQGSRKSMALTLISIIWTKQRNDMLIWQTFWIADVLI